MKKVKNRVLRVAGSITAASFFLCLFCGNLAASPKTERTGFSIAIFNQEQFPAEGVPRDLTPEWFYETLKDRFPVAFVNASGLAGVSIEKFDLLILPYGENFPFSAVEGLKKYVASGGGILTVAGRPFWSARTFRDGQWRPVAEYSPANFLASLGISYYESDKTPDIGLTVTTGLGISPTFPTSGNVFPYRLPSRDFFSLDRYFENGGSVVFVKSWKNPYRGANPRIPRKWCLVGARGDNNPFNPMFARSRQNLRNVIDIISFPVVLHELKTELAAYKQGEKVNISVLATNCGNQAVSYFATIEIMDSSGKSVFRKSRDFTIPAQGTVILKEDWWPMVFRDNFYEIRAYLKKGGVTLDQETNGFVVIDKNVLQSGPRLSASGNDFLVNGLRTLIAGTNYYESRMGELMWVAPNLYNVRRDFQKMRKIGLKLVRIHYHHPKWFTDYFYSRKLEPPEYFSRKQARPLPSEKSLRILDAVIQLAAGERLIFCADLFSLVPQEMGDPEGWLGKRERIVDRSRVAYQKQFVRIIASRYKDIPSITWDLWNEPRLDAEDLEPLRAWAREIIAEFRQGGDRHLITIGDDMSLRLMDVLDYGSIHTYEPGDFHGLDQYAKPVIFQEVWEPAGLGHQAEEGQADELRRDFSGFMKSGAKGFMPWQWTRQSRLWSNITQAEAWDDDLGLCVREDGSLKPAGEAMEALILQTF